MLNRIFLTFFIVATIACKANQRVNPDIEGSNNLQPDAQQGIVAKNLVALIERYHYKKPVINDSLSSVILDRYLKSLDAGRNYLLASDIKDFEQYRNTIDDDLRNGDVSALFKIFNVFQKRYNERISYSLTQVNNKFNFNDGGTYTYDRSKMPWLSNVAAADSLWKHRVQYDLLNLKLTGTEEAKNRETLKKRYTNLLSQAKKTNNQDAFQVMMDAFTESVDPHTNYFVPVRAQEFNEEMARTFEGIGARLGLDNEVVKIVEVIPGGPAWRSKQLNANDRIVGVAQGKDGEFEDIIGWRLDNVVAKIKGPKGTIVRLKIIPAGQELTSKPKIVELVRDKIVLQDQSAKKTIKTVTSNGKTYKIGIITLPAFYADFKAYQDGDPNYKSTSRDVKLLLDTLKQQKVDGVLIDLRTNGGGSLMEAIKLTGLFIKSGPVVQTRDIRGKVDVDEDDDPSVAYSGPLGIMVDRFSASASEIFSGAIQDYGRGIIIGNQTYGKGSVQSAIGMSKIISATDRLMLMAMNKDKSGPAVNGDPFGQINLTTGKFYRINGSSTQHKGVIPDIQFPMIFPADKYGESSEPSAMPWDTIASSNYQPVADLTAIKTQLSALHAKRMKTSAEYKYMLQDIERLKKRDTETTVTLNEAKLKKERDVQEAETLARDNQRRALKGLPPLKKGDTKPKNDIDFVQDESLNIMADFIKLGK